MHFVHDPPSRFAQLYHFARVYSKQNSPSFGEPFCFASIINKPCQPYENVHVVTALLHNDRAGFRAIAPVAAHKAMCDMEVSDVLRMIDRNNLPDFTRINNLFYTNEKWGITQHVAYSDVATKLFRPITYCETLARVW